MGMGMGGRVLVRTSWLKLTAVLDLILRTGCHLMTSLSSCQGCSPTEALHTFQGEPSYGAHI